MLPFALLLAASASAAHVAAIPRTLPPALALPAVGNVLASLPAALVAADPRIAALAARLPVVAAAAAPATPAVAAERGGVQAYEALAAVSRGLAGLDAEQISTLPAEQLGAMAATIWEHVAKAAAPAARAEPGPDGGAHYQKRYVALQYYLLGKGYHTALRALDFAKRHHKGKRKDGRTPELQHQIEIALYLSTLKGVRDEESALAAALLHDVMEDYDVERAEMEALFGKTLADTVWRLTKVHKGQKKELDVYFGEIAGDPVASLVKGADRIHNLQSMIGVFKHEKQDEYIAETERWFLPMLKRAKDTFPDQSPAYMNARQMIKVLLQTIRAARADR